MEWKQAKNQLDLLDFTNEVGIEVEKGENHEFGKANHSLKSYELYLPPILGFTVKGYYNYCPECRQVRNKKLVMFNNDQNVCYEKVFLKHGKAPDDY